MVEIKTPAEVEAMRGAGRVVAEILAAVQDQAKAGMRTAELDLVARDVLARNGAYSPFLDYHPGFAPVPFPATICTSVNDAALHGIPGRYKLADGDLLSVDCGAVLDGWTADAAISFTIGPAGPADARLIATTEAQPTHTAENPVNPASFTRPLCPYPEEEAVGAATRQGPAGLAMRIS